MGVIDLSPYKPVPATLGDANQVANGFQTLQNWANGNVDNNNFGAGKIFDPAKIMQAAAVDGDALAWDTANSKWVPASTLPVAAVKPGLYKLWDSIDAGVSLPAASITTSTLSGAFKHLVVEFICENSSGAQNFLMRVNGDTAGNYYYQLLQHTSTTITSASTAAGTSFFLGVSGTAEPAAGTVKIFNYAGASGFSKHMVVNAYCQNDGGGAQKAHHLGGMWNSAVAITTLTFLSAAGNITAGSRITVYGEA